MQSNITLRLLLFTFMLLSCMCNSFALSPSDGEYLISKQSNYEFIYPKEYKKLLKTVITINDQITRIYRKEFNWTLDEKTSLVLASSHNQIANGFATVIPFNLTTFYGGGAEHIDKFAEKSWLKGLLIHETAHLYQLNAKQSLAKYTKKIFGNNIFFMFPIVGIPIFSAPNILTPLFLLEGNAVFNESRFGNGGRLYSGEQRALFYSIVKNGKLTEDRIINEHLYFPFRGEKYIAGGYFFLFLAEKFGINRVNQFFLAQGNHYIWPFKINETFEYQFNTSYYDLFAEFINKYRLMANNQRSSSLPTIATSIYSTPMNRIGNSILLLTSNGKSAPRLLKFDRTTLKFDFQSLDLPLGKVFRLRDGRYYSATSDIVNFRDTTYTLWGEHGDYKKKYLSKLVQDIKGSNTLYFDGKNSYDEPHLYLNKRFVEKCSSSALLDNKGHYYCFKQDGKRRYLIRNGKTLFSIKGYYAKLADIVDHTIYFISSTKYGSSLFSWTQKNGIQRKSSLDTIVDAKFVSNNSFLISEVSSRGYNVKLHQLENLYSPPYEEKYFFEQHKEFTLLDKIQLKESSVTSIKDTSSYNQLLDIRYWGWNVLASSFTGNVNYSANAKFADPLLKNMFRFETEKLGNKFERYEHGLAYTNQSSILDWKIELRHKDYHTKTDSDVLEGSLKTTLPLFKIKDYSFITSPEIDYDFLVNKGPIYKLSFEINKSKFYSLSFSPKELLSFEASYEVNEGLDTETRSATGYAIQDLGGETFLTLFAKYTHSTDTNYKLEYDIQDEPIPHQEYRLQPSLKYTEFSQFGGELKKVVNSGFYSSLVPLSLRRFAPYIYYNHFKTNIAKHSQIIETGGGVEAEFLMFHAVPFKIRLGSGITNDTDSDEITFYSTINGRF